MKELSLNILDIVQNSVKAEAKLIEVEINESEKNNLLTIKIKDNGFGIEKDMIEKIQDPFTTSRTTRKVGLGISFFKMAAEQSFGNLVIESEVKVGTVLTATFQLDNIDRAPLGDIEGTISMLILVNPEIDFIFRYIKDESYTLDTREIRNVIGAIPITDLSIIKWIEDDIKENLKLLNGGA